MAEPRWLSRQVIEAMNAELIREHGGSHGIRDDGLIDSALARPRNRWGYGESDLSGLAAAYCYGLVKNHGFIDGNKRIAFMAAYVFLSVNGLELEAPETEAYMAVVDLASGGITEDEFAAWLKDRAHPAG
jgi:death on curing protein